ncbi:MAG: ribosome biogenesis GTPase YlqF [Vampirovibrionales bacterium]
MKGTIQWYPGHIAKVERELKDRLAHVDVILNVLDARLPQTTFNQRVVAQLSPNKPMVLLLNKADLADPAQTNLWVSQLETNERYTLVVPVTATSPKARQRIIKAILDGAKPLLDKLVAKGLRRRPVRAALIGMPNVGKSTLINMLVGKKKTQTGHRAGVTRGQQWVSLHKDIQLLDLPGLIPPQLESPEAGLKLASVFSVGDAAFDEETVAQYLIGKVEALYPGRLHHVYEVPEATELALKTLAEQRNLLMAGGVPDTKRMAQMLLKDFRLNRWGGVTLEHEATPSPVSPHD